MVGDFYSEHRKLIDSRKADLMRVGIAPPEHAPLRDVMPSQADALVPNSMEAPLLDASHPAVAPAKPPTSYETPKLPKLPGVNATHEE